ncbi:MAG: DUF1207 domain-containing protein [Proteobacteria bacterium]|nr:DUF1207 domain-containing protein [Pseudomonadota bacterium]
MVKNLSFFITISLALLSMVSSGRAAQADDRFVAGYATAVLEREVKVEGFSVEVNEGVLTVKVRWLTGEQGERIKEALSSIHGVEQVLVIDAEAGRVPDSDPAPYDEDVVAEREGRPARELFKALLADPKWPHFSASYLDCMGSKEFSNVGAVSFGESFGIYRGEFSPEGRWALGIEAAVFSIFDLNADSHDLINSDFWVAFPSLSFRKGDFSALGRLFHQSSHLGDEYLLRDRMDRVNLSYEGLSLKLSYDFWKAWRFYGGMGYIFHTDPPDLEPWSTQVGLEFESPRAFVGNRVRPVGAVDFQHREESNWDTDLSLRAGVQFERQTGGKGRYRLLLEYYNGHSPHGQFYNRKIEYVGIGTHLDF